MKPNTILIVDDNKGILTSLELLLEGHFDRIITLSNPNQIPATLQTASVDLVILDMNFTAEKTSRPVPCGRISSVVPIRCRRHCNGRLPLAP